MSVKKQRLRRNSLSALKHKFEELAAKMTNRDSLELPDSDECHAFKWPINADDNKSLAELVMGLPQKTLASSKPTEFKTPFSAFHAEISRKTQAAASVEVRSLLLNACSRGNSAFGNVCGYRDEAPPSTRLRTLQGDVMETTLCIKITAHTSAARTTHGNNDNNMQQTNKQTNNARARTQTRKAATARTANTSLTT